VGNTFAPWCEASQLRQNDNIALQQTEFSVAGPFFIVVCSICRKRVNVKTSKTDENGYAVHEECYVSKITVPGAANGKVTKRNWWKILARI